MKIFALADLHLSFMEDPDRNDLTDHNLYKPMGIFGSAWENHCQKIYEAWQDTVEESDLVLIAGDSSWALRLEDMAPDWKFISMLRGKKLLLQGNHDFWWQSPKKIRDIMPKDCDILQNEAFRCGDLSITGTRLWMVPGMADFGAQEEKIYRRELIRQELSLQAAKTDTIINMNHFMPVNEKREENEIIKLLRSYPVKISVYGHLHDKSHKIAMEGNHWGIDFHLTSADYLKFTPKLLLEI